jgi:hypothetical protein
LFWVSFIYWYCFVIVVCLIDYFILFLFILGLMVFFNFIWKLIFRKKFFLINFCSFYIDIFLFRGKDWTSSKVKQLSLP